MRWEWEKTGPHPTDWSQPGSQHPVLTETQGILRAVRRTGTQRHDVTQLLPLVDAVPPVRIPRGRPRRRGVAHSSGLGVVRWVVERTLAWLRPCRQLRVRHECRADMHEAFLTLGCALLCARYLTDFC